MKELKTQKKQIRKMIATLRKADDPTEALEALEKRLPFFIFDKTKVKPKHDLLADLLKQQWLIECEMVLVQFAQYGPEGWQQLHDQVTVKLQENGVDPHG